MQLTDDEAFLRAEIARIDLRSKELAQPLREAISPLALGTVIVLASMAGPAIFGAGALFARWLG